MALYIDSSEVDRLARALAEVTGLSLSDAVVLALREQLEREKGLRKISSLGEDLRAISDRCGALPDLDLRSAEAILGFDEHGLPN